MIIPHMFTQLQDSEDLDNEIDELLQEFESRCQRPILHTTVFYWGMRTAAANKRWLQ